jgi:predicted nucleic acid-binding protein
MRNRLVVVNSTPIIVLHGIQKLGVLEKLYGTVVIPTAVQNEVTVKDSGILDKYEWIEIKDVTNAAAKEAFSSALHDGEVEVMLLAKEKNADLIIIDDGLARRHAKYLNLTVTGTVGVLLRAKDSGIISAVKPLLTDLITAGFYISDKKRLVYTGRFLHIQRRTQWTTRTTTSRRTLPITASCWECSRYATRLRL